MTTTPFTEQPRPSATIHQFPPGGRAGLKQRSGGATGYAQPTWPTVDFGSGWYHDAAIEDDKRPH